VAYVVSRIGTPIDVAAMRQFLLGQLPEFMLLARVVSVQRLPLTASGKINVAALPSPDMGGSSSKADAPPRTPTERTMAAEIFGPLLGVESIGVSKNLFALGGSSLQAIQGSRASALLVRGRRLDRRLLPLSDRRRAVIELVRGPRVGAGCR